MAVILLTIFLMVKPPHKHTEAQTSTDKQINNSGQASAKTEQVAEQKVVSQQPEAEPPKPVPIQPVVHPTGCDNYSHLIAKYSWNKQVMTAICHAESGGNPNAVGDTRVIGGLYAPSCGLFQIRTLAGRPSCEELKNPEINIEWAYKIYQGQGYPAWSVCRTKVSCY